MPLGMEVGIGPGDFVFDGHPASPRKKGHSPTHFLVHVYCGQTAGWIKVPLGTEVNLGPATLLDVVAAPPKRGTAQFSVHVYCGETAGWTKTPLGTEVELGPSHMMLDGNPSPCERGTAVPLFLAHVYCGHGRPSHSATAELLYKR